MSSKTFAAQIVPRAPALCAAIYVAAMAALIAVALSSGLGIVERRAALADASALLAQLQGRTGGTLANALMTQHPGSPFLEGPTVTVAGAALLQRVAAAVQSAGGVVQSSSVDVTTTREGAVTLLVSCELEQAALQAVLYDLEAGMPLLFVDQLDVQSPQATVTEDMPQRLRIVLGISGRWEAGP